MLCQPSIKAFIGINFIIWQFRVTVANFNSASSSKQVTVLGAIQYGSLPGLAGFKALALQRNENISCRMPEYLGRATLRGNTVIALNSYVTVIIGCDLHCVLPFQAWVRGAAMG